MGGLREGLFDLLRGGSVSERVSELRGEKEERSVGLFVISSNFFMHTIISLLHST